jgi:hypothetical protein
MTEQFMRQGQRHFIYIVSWEDAKMQLTITILHDPIDIGKRFLPFLIAAAAM